MASKAALTYAFGLGLIASYTISWTLPASHFAGLSFLFSCSLILTLPYFVYHALWNRIARLLAVLFFTSILLILGIVFPPILVLLPLLSVMALGARIEGFFRKLPFVSAGFCLYGALFLSIEWRQSNPFVANLEFAVPVSFHIATALIGFILLYCALWSVRNCRCDGMYPIALVIGCVAYVLIFLLSFLIPGVQLEDDGTESNS
jgi:hypothetical protein